MEKEQIVAKINELFATLPRNVLTQQDAIPAQYVGTVLFDAPLVGFGAADDALFDEYKKGGVIGPWHMSPNEWLGGAQSVISLFFPISEQVRASNRSMKTQASAQWTYARIEGQRYITQFTKALEAWLAENGVRVCVPANDPRFAGVRFGKGIDGYEMDETIFGSRWSERHAAYVCGLGTFGLSKGLITKKGIAGRFASVIVDLQLPADKRAYTDIYEYCTRCGACAARCHVNAIDLEHGKDHMICGKEQDRSSVIHAPRYGCGLCQVGVPCETGIPKRK